MAKEITGDKAVIKSEQPEDQAGQLATIYSVSGWQIIWRNFLAGISRALGSVFVYVIVLTITGYLFSQIILPVIQPLIDQYLGALDAVSSLQELNQSRESSLPPALQELLDRN